MASHFIGAKISLISRSEIRYKGTLVAIDHGAATISLQKVQSMGTEGRRGPDGPEIPISETNYDFIVFKAADVKNLTVEQPPPVQPQPSSNVPDDPAIVGTTRPSPKVNPPSVQPSNIQPPSVQPSNLNPTPRTPSQRPFFNQQPPPNGFGPGHFPGFYPPPPHMFPPGTHPAYFSGHFPPPPQPQQPQSLQQQQQPQSQPQGEPQPPSAQISQPIPQPPPANQQQPPSQQPSEALIQPKSQPQPDHPVQQQPVQHQQPQPTTIVKTEIVPEKIEDAMSRIKIKEEARKEIAEEARKEARHEFTRQHRNNEKLSHPPTSTNRHYNNHSKPRKYNNRTIVPKSDFDFQSSNAAFQKISNKTESNNGDEENEEIELDAKELLSSPLKNQESNETQESFQRAYDRSSSFFDSLSSGNQNQQQERQSFTNKMLAKAARDEERNRNIDTFGEASAMPNQFYYNSRGRGGGPHRGYRGSYRGRRNFNPRHN